MRRFAVLAFFIGLLGAGFWATKPPQAPKPPQTEQTAQLPPAPDRAAPDRVAPDRVAPERSRADRALIEPVVPPLPSGAVVPGAGPKAAPPPVVIDAQRPAPTLPRPAAAPPVWTAEAPTTGVAASAAPASATPGTGSMSASPDGKPGPVREPAKPSALLPSRLSAQGIVAPKNGDVPGQPPVQPARPAVAERQASAPPSAEKPLMKPQIKPLAKPQVQDLAPVKQARVVRPKLTPGVKRASITRPVALRRAVNAAVKRPMSVAVNGVVWRGGPPPLVGVSAMLAPSPRLATAPRVAPAARIVLNRI